jgi:outer membrane murein-binding lipoprotein Lpp
LEEEILALRMGDSAEAQTERASLELDVTQLSGQVQTLLARVHQLEAGAEHRPADGGRDPPPQPGLPAPVAQGAPAPGGNGKTPSEDAEVWNLLHAKDARVRELEQRSHDLSMALEEEKRSHISALELVQELREAEEEWARVVRQCDDKLAIMAAKIASSDAAGDGADARARGVQPGRGGEGVEARNSEAGDRKEGVEFGRDKHELVGTVAALGAALEASREDLRAAESKRAGSEARVSSSDSTTIGGRLEAGAGG